MAIARRAMAPIAGADRARGARSRAPATPPGKIPEPLAEDEVAELARTLEGMLHELDAAREETEADARAPAPVRRRRLHELRTPLTSILANLELLAESLNGDQGDAAARPCALERMRRLVADLLLLARRDGAQEVARAHVDLAQVVVEAAAELGPVSDHHAISLDVHPAPLEGSAMNCTASRST